MFTKSKEKRELILTKAKDVFVRKGFNRTTMKDIIEECGISRGGIYLYFSSIDEIFIEVINRHNQLTLEKTKNEAQENDNFEIIIDNYFRMQKERLLHMENSLLLSVFEFFIAHKDDPDKDFFSGTTHSLEKTIIEILNYGITAGYVTHNNIHILASNILYCIKGLETQAMTYGVTEEQLEKQFGFYKKLILYKEGISDEK